MVHKDYILGIDYGDKRIGIAIAHCIARLPRPLLTIENTKAALQAVADIVDRENVQLVVVGMPRSMDGNIQAQAKLVEDFGAKLAAVLPVPVTFVDETLTSVEAERILMETTEQKGITKEAIDAMAASLILERYFDEHATGTV